MNLDLTRHEKTIVPNRCRMFREGTRESTDRLLIPGSLEMGRADADRAKKVQGVGKIESSRDLKAEIWALTTVRSSLAGEGMVSKRL
jgi:hypothetical protein